MNVIFKKLIPELCEDYLYYFDHVAFTDNESFSACYCLESHLSKKEDELLDNKLDRRNKVRELIEAGIMQGYLIYDGDNDEAIVGWCNTGNKKSYIPLSNQEHQTVDLIKNKVKALYCIEIAPAYRGKGISHLVMKKVCEDAKTEGYDYVEGYPFSDQEFQYQYHGPMHLYEKHGFTRVADRLSFCIMSKKL